MRRRRTGSPSSSARCSRAATVAPFAPRPWTGSSRLHAERTILAKLACARAGAAVPLAPQAVRSQPNGKVTASRRTAAGLRPAVPAPLPKSPSDRMHARGRFPKCSGTNAPTRPMIASPSFANRFAKSLLVVRSHWPCQSCGCVTYAWRGSLGPCEFCLGPGAIGPGVLRHPRASTTGESRRDPQSLANSPRNCVPYASSSSSLPALYLGRAEGTGPLTPERSSVGTTPPGRWGNACRGNATGPDQ